MSLTTVPACMGDCYLQSLFIHRELINKTKKKRKHETAHSVTLLPALGEIQPVLNLKAYGVQKRFLVLTSPCYKRHHRLIGFVGIDAVLLRGSLAHGCNTKGQGKTWAISTELWQCRSIRRSQACMWHTTTQNNQKHCMIWGAPVTLCALKEFVL